MAVSLTGGIHSFVLSDRRRRSGFKGSYTRRQLRVSRAICICFTAGILISKRPNVAYTQIIILGRFISPLCQLNAGSDRTAIAPLALSSYLERDRFIGHRVGISPPGIVVVGTECTILIVAECIDQTPSIMGNWKNNISKTSDRRRTKINVVSAVAVNSQVSSRAIARESGMSRISVLNILLRNNIHPYNVCLLQELHGNDFENCVNFCTWKLRHDTSELLGVLFRDKATFTNHDKTNLKKHALLVSKQTPMTSSNVMSASMECKCVVWNSKP
ncbi:hypothetical protein PR048_004350 [Dryococelus australis]|uniref:Transposase n=1 Tax=Dryococelus australis TaxID=614101 RepID=A0ABQ9I577_9NEOP|nr:hypothetical protein PR048_004350 [Dryococelus australis]